MDFESSYETWNELLGNCWKLVDHISSMLVLMLPKHSALQKKIFAPYFPSLAFMVHIVYLEQALTHEKVKILSLNMVYGNLCQA